MYMALNISSVLDELNIQISNGYQEFFTENRVQQLVDIMNTVKNDTFFPNISNIFRFTNIPVENIKCIFVGQDPYANYKFSDELKEDIVPEATGRSFEVNSMNAWTDKIKQSSLRNILKSLYYLQTGEKETLEKIREKISSGCFFILSPHDWFNYLEEQGVMFLNTCLTVKKDEPGSHIELWNDFSNDLVRYLNEKNPKIQWILAGKVAQNAIGPMVNNSICTSHPRLDSFVRECPFKLVDDIDWFGKTMQT